MSQLATITFTGSFHGESFVGFVQDRARLLALAATVDRSRRNEIVVTVAGEPDLIGAFEMACSLGPPDALVYDVAMQVIERPCPVSP